jgi:hypothetical protein
VVNLEEHQIDERMIMGGCRQRVAVVGAILSIWTSAVSAEPPAILSVVKNVDAPTEQAAKKTIGSTDEYEGFVRWEIARGNVNTFLEGSGPDAFTFSPFPEYQYLATKTSYRIDNSADDPGGGYPAIWEGELEVIQGTGGGRIIVYVTRHCESDRSRCLMIHAYPDNGFIDKLLFERVIGIWETEIASVYVVVETKVSYLSNWWNHRNDPPYH